MLTVTKSTRKEQFGGLWLEDEKYTYAYNPCRSSITRWETETGQPAGVITHHRLRWWNLSDDQVIEIINDWDNVKKRRDESRKFNFND